MNILVVDDDKVDRLSVREMLDGDYTVLEAQSADDAHRCIDSYPIDCVLLDYLIPGTDSLLLLSEISAKHLPVIMLTGEGSEKVAVSAMKEGAQDYINKRSLSGELLSKAIANAVDTVGLKRKLAEKQEELQAANNELLSKVEELQRLTGDLENLIHLTAHDLREPIRNLCNYCDLFERSLGLDLPAASKQQLTVIKRNAVRLSSLIDDLRALTRVVHGNPEAESIELSEVVQEAVVEFQSILDARMAVLRVEKLPQVKVIRQLMVQLYRNLIGNALKYSSDQSLQIEITSCENENTLVLGVRNSGSMVAAADSEKIFQPFFRLPNSKGLDGTGMGLALCRKIIERHGGKIWVEVLLPQEST